VRLNFLTSFRRRIIQSLFALVLIWPPLHAVTAELTGFSPWRLFGWGMYSTPHPESLLRLNLLWVPPEHSDPSHLQELQARMQGYQEGKHQNDCLGIWIETENGLVEKDVGDPCDLPAFEEHLAHFKAFGSKKDLVSLVKLSATLTGEFPALKSFLFVTRQRLDLGKRRAFTESAYYEVSGTSVRGEGRFRLGWSRAQPVDVPKHSVVVLSNPSVKGP
jgi:hypothetical protein